MEVEEAQKEKERRRVAQDELHATKKHAMERKMNAEKQVLDKRFAKLQESNKRQLERDQAIIDDFTHVVG